MTIYTALIVRKHSVGDALAQAVLAGRDTDLAVYVVGMEDGDALAREIINNALSLDATMINTDLTLHCTYVEAVGRPDINHSVDDLMRLAQQRVRDIEQRGTTRR